MTDACDLPPTTVALLDQADAANRHAHNVMHAMGDIFGTPAVSILPGPPTRALVERLNTRGMTGRLELCPHLSYTQPAPAFWLAYAPTQIRCARCAAVAARRVRGTREDRRCDHCRKVRSTIFARVVQLPAIVVGSTGSTPAGCIPPVQVMYGLCPPCQRADGPPPASPTGAPA